MTNPYGRAHQILREALVAKMNGKPCVRCGHPLRTGDAVDLDHTDDRGGYLGLAHAACNRRAGARKGNRLRNLRINSREW
ncbi:MAG: hypothetical protein ACT4QG_09300 [Sporichthyaceae bacterium]